MQPFYTSLLNRPVPELIVTIAGEKETWKFPEWMSADPLGFLLRTFPELQDQVPDSELRRMEEQATRFWKV